MSTHSKKLLVRLAAQLIQERHDTARAVERAFLLLEECELATKFHPGTSAWLLAEASVKFLKGDNYLDAVEAGGELLSAINDESKRRAEFSRKAQLSASVESLFQSEWSYESALKFVTDERRTDRAKGWFSRFLKESDLSKSDASISPLYSDLTRSPKTLWDVELIEGLPTDHRNYDWAVAILYCLQSGSISKFRLSRLREKFIRFKPAARQATNKKNARQPRGKK